MARNGELALISVPAASTDRLAITWRIAPLSTTGAIISPGGVRLASIGVADTVASATRLAPVCGSADPSCAKETRAASARMRGITSERIIDGAHKAKTGKGIRSELRTGPSTVPEFGSYD